VRQGDGKGPVRRFRCETRETIPYFPRRGDGVAGIMEPRGSGVGCTRRQRRRRRRRRRRRQRRRRRLRLRCPRKSGQAGVCGAWE